MNFSMRLALAATILTLSGTSFAGAEIKGMPGLDATKPIGAAEAPKASENTGDLTAPMFTDAQVERGRRSYVDNCSDCHGSELNNGEFGGAPLKGTYFDERWGQATVDGLFYFLQAAMPPNRPGSLNDQTYTDIVTFILAKNGYRSTNSEMPADVDRMGTMSLEKK